MNHAFHRQMLIFASIFALLVYDIAADDEKNRPLPNTTIPDKISDVAAQPTFFYTTQDTVLCGKQLHDAFMDDLFLSAKIANVLQNRKYEIQMKDSLFIASDQKGLNGEFILAHKSDHRLVYYGEGTFKKASIFSVTGRAIVDIITVENSDSTVMRDMALFLKIDRGSVGFLAKIAAKIPILGHLIRQYATDKSLSFASLSRDIAYKLRYEREKSLAILSEKLTETDYQRLLHLLDTQSR